MKVLALVVLFALVAIAYSVPAWGGVGYGYKIAHPHYSVSHYGYAPVHGYWGGYGHGGYGHGWGGYGHGKGWW